MAVAGDRRKKELENWGRVSFLFQNEKVHIHRQNDLLDA